MLTSTQTSPQERNIALTKAFGNWVAAQKPLMEETKNTGKIQKEPVYIERPDGTIIRTKHPRLEIRVLDANCTPKQLEHALRMAYEWKKHQNRMPHDNQEYQTEK